VVSVITLHNTLSQAVSVMSVKVDTISQNVSVLSQQVSIISQQLSVLSQVVSLLSVRHDTLSQAVSVMSVKVDTLSQAISVHSQQISILSQQISIHSQQISVLSQQVSVLSQAVSILSAGFGLVQMKVVAGSQAQTSVLVKISGLSASMALSAYQIEGMILYSASATGLVNFGFSTSAAVFATFAGRWDVMVSAASNTRSVAGFGALVRGTFNTRSNTQVVAAAGTAGIIQWAEVRAVARVTTAGSIQAKVTPVAGTDVTILQGSWLRAYKIG